MIKLRNSYFSIKRFLPVAMIIVVVFAAGFILFCVTPAHAAVINATNLLGAVDGNGNPVWTRDTTNNSPFVPNGLSPNDPFDVAIDTVNHRLFVADYGNNRILAFSINSNDSLVSSTAIFVLGQPNLTTNSPNTTQNGLTNPQGITWDATNNRLFVADTNNYRVLAFSVPANATSGIDGENATFVLGQANFTAQDLSDVNQNTLSGAPQSAAYDSANSRLFVSDTQNGRVLSFSVPANATSGINGEAATFVLGEPDFVSVNQSIAQNGLDTPYYSSYDATNNRLFVNDNAANRVMAFSVPSNATSGINGENAIFVLGQTSFTASSHSTTQSTIFHTNGSSYDATNSRLFVTDPGGERVLGFSVPANATSGINGEAATFVLGQTNFTSSTATTTQSGLHTPGGETYDSGNNLLFVGDAGNNRVMAFSVPANATSGINGEAATYEVGQYTNTGAASFTISNSDSPLTTNAQGFSGVTSAALDSVNHRLFVSDASNNRILVFPLDTTNNIATTTAQYVLGACNLTTTGTGAVSSSTFGFTNITYDAINSRLFASAGPQNRVLAFNVATSTIANCEGATFVLGQTSFTSSTSAVTQSGLSSNDDIVYDPVNSRLFVSDESNNRVLAFSVPANATSGINGEAATLVLGQTGFTASGVHLTQSGLSGPDDSVYDSADNRYFVGDTGNARVMVFSVPANATSGINGENAQANLSQVNFTSNATGTSQNTFFGIDPNGYDPTNNRFFVHSGNIVVQFNFIHITNVSFPSGTVSSAYSQTLTTTSTQGTSQKFSIFSGSLPTGLSLATSTGVISGTPSVATTTTAVIEADDNFSDGSIFFDRETYTFEMDGGGGSLPIVTVQAASSVATSSATLNGTLTSTGIPSSTVEGFNYGTSTAYGFVVSSTGTFASGTFNQSLSALTPNTTYHYQAYATNAGGTAASSDQTFTTSSTLPTVTIQAATSVATSSATLNGTLTSTGIPSSTVEGFNYGTSTAYGLVVSSTGTFASGTFNQAIAGLIPNTTYHFQAYATNGGGTATSSDQTFTTSSTVPTVTVQAASAVSTSSATLNGTLISTGIPSSTVEGFNYGTSTAYGSVVSSTGTFASGTFNQAITNLLPNTTYHYQAYATNSGGTATSSDQTFTASPTFPTVTVQVATSVATSSVTLNGTLTSTGIPSSTVEGFNYGISTAYGSVVSSTGVFGSGTFTQSIFGLLPNTTYHYQAYATNTGGTATSSDQTFTTGATVPTVTVQTASSVATSSATLNGTLTSTGIPSSTVEGFNYGTTTGYGSVVSSTGTFASGTFNQAIAGLIPNTTYHFQAYATNGGGTATSSDQTFTTANNTSTYTLSYTAGANGTITGSSTQTVLSGGNGTAVTAVATSGYSFVNWSDASTINPRTDTNVTGNITVTANFAANTPPTITPVVNNGGGSGGSFAPTTTTIPVTVVSTSTTETTTGTRMTVSQMETLLASLEAQLQTLEAEAGSLAFSGGGTGAGGVTTNFIFTRNLSLWSTGNDVKQLQLFLIGEKSGSAAAALAAHGTTDIFGILTFNALVEFQEKVAITPASGYFGPITRGKVNTRD